MRLTRAQVEKVALLARLQFAPAELDRLTEQLGQIVEYVDQLQAVDTRDVEPMAHALDVTNVLRADARRPSPPREELLAVSPRPDREFFLAPAVLGD